MQREAPARRRVRSSDHGSGGSQVVPAAVLGNATPPSAAGKTELELASDDFSLESLALENVRYVTRFSLICSSHVTDAASHIGWHALRPVRDHSTSCLRMTHWHDPRVQDAAGADLDFTLGELIGELDPASRPASAGSTFSSLSLYRTQNLVGREQQVAAVLGSLHTHGAAVVWGSPGEGKTAVATEAGCRLQNDVTANICLSVIIDINGAHAFTLSVPDALCCRLHPLRSQCQRFWTCCAPFSILVANAMH